MIGLNVQAKSAQPFESFQDFQSHYGSIIPMSSADAKWRLVADAPVGHINGCPEMRGQAVATNGILLFILRSGGDFVLGHYNWFLCDEPDDSGEKNLSTIEKKATAKSKKVADDLSGLEEFWT